MERNFSFDDAKNLIHRHKRLQARLIDFMNADKRYMDMVSDISGRYITTEVLKELRNIPVEELNRDKLGNIPVIWTWQDRMDLVHTRIFLQHLYINYLLSRESVMTELTP